MKTFAYLIHPYNLEHLKKFFSGRRFIPSFLVRLFFRDTWPFQVYKIKGLPGYLIALPMLFRQIDSDVMEAMDKIIIATDIAKDLKVKILGLGGYTSLLCDKGYTALRTLKIPLTSGSTYVAWSAFEAIYRASKIKQLDLKKSSVAVINATSAIGSLCSRKLSAYVNKLILNSHPDVEPHLQHLKETILHLSPLEIALETDISAAVKDADIVLFTDDIPEVSLGLESVKPNAIVCDASVNRSFAVKAKARPDITIIEAGLIKMPKPVKFSVNTGLPYGIIPASMAEVILLALEEKFASYSLGENINLDKMEEIADIAARHGFEVWVPEAPVL